MLELTGSKDLPVFNVLWQGESGTCRGEGASPREKCNLRDQKDGWLVYTERCWESKNGSSTYNTSHTDPLGGVGGNIT